MRLFPGIWKHSFKVYLFMAVGTGLFLSNNAPTSDTKFMKPAKKIFMISRVEKCKTREKLVCRGYLE